MSTMRLWHRDSKFLIFLLFLAIFHFSYFFFFAYHYSSCQRRLSSTFKTRSNSSTNVDDEIVTQRFEVSHNSSAYSRHLSSLQSCSSLLSVQSNEKSKVERECLTLSKFQTKKMIWKMWRRIKSVIHCVDHEKSFAE